jgi:protein-disulfide isomerase
MVTQLAVSVKLLIAINDLRDRLFVPSERTAWNPGSYLSEEVKDVSADDDPSLGPDCTPVTVIEFSDFRCPSCAAAQDTLREIREKYDEQIRIVFRDFPLSGEGTPSFLAAEAAECADEQGKFWEMHDIMFARQHRISGTDGLEDLAREIGLDTELFEACLASGKYTDEVKKDRADGEAYGVMGTPTFFVNGRMIVGGSTVSFEEAIDSILASQTREGCSE